MAEIHREVHRWQTLDGQVKYRLKEYDVFDSFTFDNFTTTEFLWWMQVVETAIKSNPDWSYEFEAGGGHDDISCYLTVHRFKETTEVHWKAYMNKSEKKSKDSRRQDYLRLKKEFENEEEN